MGYEGAALLMQRIKVIILNKKLKIILKLYTNGIQILLSNIYILIIFQNTLTFNALHYKIIRKLRKGIRA